MKAPRSRQEATSGALPLSKRGRLQRAAGLVEGVAQLLRRRRAAGGGADRAALGAERLAGVGGDVDRVAVGGVDDGAEQLAAADRVRRDDGRAGVGGERPFERTDGGGGVVEGEDEHRRFVADAERLQPPAQLRGLQPPAERPGEDVAGEAALGLAGDAAAHQLERDDRDRLLQDQPLEVAEAAGVADDHDPGLRRARRPARSPGGPGPGPATEGWAGTKGWPSPAWPSASLRIAPIASAESWRRKPRPARRSPRPSRIADGAADRGGDRRRDFLQAALLEDQPLEPALHGDAALQHLVLLVDEAGEGLLGDRDERRRVGDLEEREVALLGLVDQRFRQLLVAEAGAEAEPGEVAVGEQADEGALLGGAVERDPGGQHQLAAGEPRGRVLELGDVDPAHRRGRRLGAGREVEVELVEQALDGEHPAPSARTRSQASVSTPCSTSWISSNCSVSAISGGASCTTGSPRSSARQIRPRL